MVAAVLHLDEGACTAFEPIDEMRGRFPDGHDIVDPDLLFRRNGGPRAPGSTLRLPHARAELLLVAQHQGDLRHGCESARLDLRSATRHHDLRIGSPAPDPANRLPGLPHRFGGYGTGIDHHRISEARRLRVRTNDFGFLRIEAAAESDNVHTHDLRRGNPARPHALMRRARKRAPDRSGP